MSKKINYNAKTFDDYKSELTNFTKKYYPNIVNDFNDASIGQWFIDLNSAVADDLGYHMDRMFQETQSDYAQEKRSILNIARTNGFKIGGKKPSIAEVKWSCFIPALDGNPDFSYAPIIRKSSQASGGGQRFELTEDLNFAEQFNSDGISNRTLATIKDPNNNIYGYNVTKTAIMIGSESRIYRYQITDQDVKPFFEIILPENNVIFINSIIIKPGSNNKIPTASEFMGDSEERWYEVNNLTEDKIFKDDYIQTRTFTQKLIESITGQTGVTSGATYGNTYVASMDDNSRVYGFIPRVGSWESIDRKFTVEYTDNGYCKITFGSGSDSLNAVSSIYSASDFVKYHVSKIINNSYLGQLPSSGSEMFIYYSVGGGNQSNVGAGAINGIPYMDISIPGSDEGKKNAIRSSVTVTNETPSVFGRDELSVDEIRNLIKYNNSAQDRCVTIKDYYNRIMTMPSRFGSPFKVGVSEKNNKIYVTLLGLSYDGTLSNQISEALVNNIISYLSEYKMINDYVVIKAGKILNLRFIVDVTVEDEYEQSQVARSIAMYIGNHMDINKHRLGEEIYVSRMRSDIGNISGVKNLIDLKVYNMFGLGYSSNTTKQDTIQSDNSNNALRIDLSKTDNVLYSDDDTMFEIKKPLVDIIVNTKYK